MSAPQAAPAAIAAPAVARHGLGMRAQLLQALQQRRRCTSVPCRICSAERFCRLQRMHGQRQDSSRGLEMQWGQGGISMTTSWRTVSDLSVRECSDAYGPARAVDMRCDTVPMDRMGIMAAACKSA